MPDIMHLIRIKAAPERVFAALAAADGIREWWTRDSELEPRLGGAGEFRFYGGKVVTRVRIDALDRPSRVAWTVTESTAPGGWETTTISFDLRPEGTGTAVLFAQRGFARADDAYALVSMGWAYYLVSLQQYLETGAGAPHPDVDFTRVVRPAPLD